MRFDVKQNRWLNREITEKWNVPAEEDHGETEEDDQAGHEIGREPRVVVYVLHVNATQLSNRIKWKLKRKC